MKALYIIAVIAAILIGPFTACRKKNNESPTHAMITGQWKQQYIMLDLNGNGVRDTGDVFTSGFDIYGFSRDGSGYIGASPAMGYPIHWTLLDNDANLRIITYSAGAADTATYHIDTITATAMRWYGSGAWIFFERQ